MTEMPPVCYNVCMNGEIVKIPNWKQNDVFETYFLMGPSRTLKALSSETGIAVGTLRKWSRDFGWKAELQERDYQASKEVRKLNNQLYIEQCKARHLNFYQKVQEKSMKKLESAEVSFESDKDAAIALDIGIKGERDVLGLRDTKLKAGILSKEGFAAMVEAIIGPAD